MFFKNFRIKIKLEHIWDDLRRGKIFNAAALLLLKAVLSVSYRL